MVLSLFPYSSLYAFEHIEQFLESILFYFLYDGFCVRQWTLSEQRLYFINLCVLSSGFVNSRAQKTLFWIYEWFKKTEEAWYLKLCVKYVKLPMNMDQFQFPSVPCLPLCSRYNIIKYWGKDHRISNMMADSANFLSRPTLPTPLAFW